MNINQQELDILRKVSKEPKLSQRNLANDLNLSIGKVNYVLKELKKKGFIKIQNFKNNPKKTGYFYLLTPRGISEKTKLTIRFMERKLKEYDELRMELGSVNNVDNNKS